MSRLSLISLATMMMAALVAGNVNAQEAPPRKVTVGPALEFSGGGTSFGIQGKVKVFKNFSVRPLILFGYTLGVGESDYKNGTVSTGGVYSGFGITQENVNAPGNFASGKGTVTPNITRKIDPALEKNLLGNNLNNLLKPVSGTAYGIAFTYDFTLLPESKLSGYVGPRILFASAATDRGSEFKANETSIGIVAGVDYTIFNNLTAGLNVTYNFATIGSYKVRGQTFGKDTIQENYKYDVPFSSGDFKIGVNVGYNF